MTETVAKHHMIAAANPHAAEAGLEMMRAGGSAVDAAIATQMVLGLVEPESSGIGGGAFMLVYNPKTKQTTSFDGREMAPASATPTMFLDADGQPRSHVDAIPGGLSVGIPGVVKMLALAHKKYGKLPWAKLFEPAIKLAEDGFPVGPKLARTIRGFTPRRQHARHQGAFLSRRRHAAGGRRDLQESRNMPRACARSPRKARTVSTRARSPRRSSTRCSMRRGQQGGMTLADLANYQAQERAPVCGDYREYHLCSMGPPSSGGIAVLQILGMLQRFPSDRSCSRARSAARICSPRPAGWPMPTAPNIWAIRLSCMCRSRA